MEFDDVYKEIESKYEEYERTRRQRLSKDREKEKRKRKVRKRDVGGAGRPFKLKARERFLMLLVYYRLYITYTLPGFLFDLDQSNVCRDLSILEPLVMQYVPLPRKLYKRTVSVQDIERRKQAKNELEQETQQLQST